MKKLLTLALCLTLCVLPLLGVAEAATDDYLNAVDPSGTFSFYYPDTYTLLDKNTIATLLNSIDAESDLGKVLEQSRAVIESGNLVMLLSADNAVNINIIGQNAGVALTDAQLLASADSFVAQLKASIPGLEITDEPTIVEQDGFKPMVLGYQYETNGMTMNGYQGYFSIDAMFFCVIVTGTTITSQAAQDFGFVMASIALQ